MKLLKNPELKTELSFILLAGAAFAGFGIGWIGVKAAVLMLGFALFLCVSVFFFAKSRYDKITKLSESIDVILHNSDQALEFDNKEGELAVLVSEVQKMTVRLREQNDLLRSDKIRLTNAIADIFHQMRTPLTSMNLVVSLLSEENIDYTKRIDLVRDLKRQLERMSWLTESLLKMSKIDAGTAVFEPAAVSVREVLSKASGQFLVAMELRCQELKINCSGERFNVDPSWTAEAIANLIKNCMEHTPEGGCITINARETALFTEVTVEDDGEGFVKEDIPYLFDRFYKGKNSSEQSIGIGLALSRAIIAAENGTISAENTKNGAKFIIKIYKSVV